MPRLTLRFLLKVFVLLMVLLFFVPMLMTRIDSKEDTARRANRIKKELEAQFPEHDSFGSKRTTGLPTLRKNVDRNDAAGNGGVALMDQGEAPGAGDGPNNDGQKLYGPKAVLRKGILGNFEPDIKPKYGPGEGGEALHAGMAEKAAAEQSVREYGFNMVVSDKIAMDRTIPDTRPDECKFWQYPEDLPTASVIIVFHNEGFSTLVRTVHSVINMSPPHLLHEVVMVDDFSTKEHLRGKLEDYIKQFNGKVKLYRNPERLGLILTRTNGARYATGDVIVFLDAHCECNRNWLPPLLARIRYDRTIMAVPIVDGIDWNTFRYSPVYQQGELYRGIFEWGFLYKESRVPDQELRKREHNSEPYWSPTHAGGLFAMDRNYFFELGAYDPGLQIWGGENFELSFKIWQCGGSIEWVPCSHVGHVYRNHMPYGFGKISPKIPVILLNYMRVVEVWLDDEFKEYFYTREPTIRGYPIGDIDKQLEFKRQHNCKSFKWFMDNIAYEVYEKFPLPPPNIGWGEIKLRTGRDCWDTYQGGVGGKIMSHGCHHMGGSQIKQRSGYSCWDNVGQGVGGAPIIASTCHHLGGNQLFRFNAEGQIGVGERCVDASGNELTIQYCPVQPTGPWQLDQSTGLIRHKKQNKCVTAANRLELRTCNANDPQQQYEINKIKTW